MGTDGIGWWFPDSFARNTSVATHVMGHGIRIYANAGALARLGVLAHVSLSFMPALWLRWPFAAMVSLSVRRATRRCAPDLITCFGESTWSQRAVNSRTENHVDD